MSDTFMHVAVSFAAFVAGFTVTFAALWLGFKYATGREERQTVADVQAMWDDLDRLIGNQERLKKEEE